MSSHSLLTSLIATTLIGMTGCSIVRYEDSALAHKSYATAHEKMIFELGGRPTYLDSRKEQLEERLGAKMYGVIGEPFLTNVETFLNQTAESELSNGLDTLYVAPSAKRGYFGGKVLDGRIMLLFEDSTLPLLYHEFSHVWHNTISKSQYASQFRKEWREISQPKYHNKKISHLHRDPQAKEIYLHEDKNFVPKDGVQTFYGLTNEKEDIAECVTIFCTGPQHLRAYAKSEEEKDITRKRIDVLFRWNFITADQLKNANYYLSKAPKTN